MCQAADLYFWRRKRSSQTSGLQHCSASLSVCSVLNFTFSPSFLCLFSWLRGFVSPFRHISDFPLGANFNFVACRMLFPCSAVSIGSGCEHLTFFRSFCAETAFLLFHLPALSPVRDRYFRLCWEHAHTTSEFPPRRPYVIRSITQYMHILDFGGGVLLNMQVNMRVMARTSLCLG